MAERVTLNAALKVKNEATKDVELTVEKVTVSSVWRLLLCHHLRGASEGGH